MASVGASTNDVSGIKRKDPAWEWGECKNPLVKNNITCKLCGKEMSGGISRLKEHLTHIKGNVLSCDKVPNDIKKKCEELIVQKRQKKYSRQRIDYMMENEASLLSGDIEHVVEDEDPFSGKSSGSGSATSKNKMKRTSDVRGPLDTMLKPDFGKMKQKTLDKNNPIKEELKMKAWNSLSKWTLEAGIPFNAVRCPSFQQAMHDVGEYGRGMPVPSYHQMRTNLFSNRLQETKQFIESFREHWVATGCSIMSDFWTDGKGRSLINFLVNCPKGTVFLKSIDASEHIKDANLIVKLVNEVILDVGADNIVQFVTDNGSNFKAAGRILEGMHPKMFWTPCAAHCVNLMLQELGDKLPKIKSAVAQGKAVVTYIYNHGRVLSMMRELTGGKELHRSCVTRFATNFYTLKTIYENRHHLQVLFVSEKWMKSEFAKKTDGKRVMMIVSKNDFWENVQFTCQVLAPLVDVLRLVDTEEKPSMGYLYEAMDRAKEQIEKNIGSTSRVYIKISEIIDKRWEDQLHHPLHAAAFYLNPGFFYKIPKREMDTGRYREMKFGLYKAINKLVPEEVEHDQIKLDMRKYAEAAGLLGSQSAIRQRGKIQPGEWWYVNGFDVPCLQTFAIRVLSLTCSASPCERNWSAFDHTDMFDQVIKECDEHHLELQNMMRKIQEEGLDIQTTRNADHFGSVIHHLSLIRNKRCLMAYVYNRAEVIQGLRWKVGHILPQEIKGKLNYSEIEYFKNHSEALESYMSELELDLTVDMVPPKDPYIKVRVLQDIGHVPLGDQSSNLARYSIHFLKRTDAEHFISLGLMEELSG